MCFVVAETLRAHSVEELELPPYAPAVAVEEKIKVNLGGCSSLVIVVDAKIRLVLVIDENGRRTASQDDMLVQRALPEFEYSIREYFETALNRRY